MMINTTNTQQLLGEEASLLEFSNPKICKDQLTLPHGEIVDRVFTSSDRNNRVLVNLQRLYHSGNLAGTGYLSILPIDQGIEHSAAASFTSNPIYFDAENIVKLAMEARCNAVASSLGVLGLVSRKYAYKIPFIIKLNHNELLSSPNTHDQILFASVDQACEMGAAGIGATIYFGSAESSRQIVEISKVFAYAHQRGLLTILWCYLRNNDFKQGKDYHLSADLTGQANHLGVTIEADIIKQKLPENNGGYRALNSRRNTFGKYDKKIYSKLCSDHPIDLARYQLMNNYAGKIPLINSGGASGQNALTDAIRTAVINKRAGGSGLILGRKAFQIPMKEGIKIIHAVQSVYMNPEISIV